MKHSVRELSPSDLAALHGASDAGQFYAVLEDLLQRSLGAEAYAIELVDRRGRSFVDHVHGGFAVAESGAGNAHQLVLGGQVFGSLLLPSHCDAEQETLGEICQQVGIALYHHKLLEDQGRLITESLAHVEALKTLGGMLGGLDSELVINRLLKFFIDLVDAEVGAAVLFEDATCLATARWGIPDRLLHYLYSASQEAHRSHPNEALHTIDLHQELTESYSFKTILRLRLNLRGPYLSEIYLVSGQDLQIGHQLRSIIESSLGLASIVVQSTLEHRDKLRQMRVDEQLVLAQDIQRQLLPESLPQSENLQIVARSTPAMYIGGDYYDVLRMASGDFLAIIADVSGKGIQAAMRSNGLRAMFSHYAMEDLQPGEVLARLNDFLSRESLTGHFTTAIVARLDPQGRSLRLSSAGHEPPLLISAAGSARFIEVSGGLPLGIVAEQVYEDSELELGVADRLMFYTDGITDTNNEQEEAFGAERMLASFCPEGEKSVTELLDGLFEEVQAFRGEMPWTDDLTAIAFQRQSKDNG